MLNTEIKIHFKEIFEDTADIVIVYAITLLLILVIVT